MALDVQDQWSRANWPWIQALQHDGKTPLSDRARAFVDWLELFRFEGPDGKPGAEAFLAHPLSQVMPFLVLVRDRYEDELVATHEIRYDETVGRWDEGLGLPLYFARPLVAGTLITAFGNYGRAAIIVSTIYLVGIVAAPFFPETRGQPLLD